MPGDRPALRRAAPLPADERRAAILAAAIPLLREQGANISTRELAAAAGVAEGTLFRVFPDKRALLWAAITEATDPEPVVAELGLIDRTLALEERIGVVLALLAARMEGIVPLVMALHDLGRIEGEDLPRPSPEEHAERHGRVLDAIAAVLEPDRAVLRVTPLEAAALLQAVSLGGRFPGAPDAARVPPHLAAQCLAHGLSTARDAGPADAAPLSTASEEV